MTIVTFDYATWAARFPEFSNVSQPLATTYFGEACLYVDNTDASPISADPPNGPRALILNLATAHLAKLYSGTAQDGQASGLVGRLSQAAEGSVNVSVEIEPGGAEPSRAWWVQTPYGFSAWQAMAPYRIGIYVAPPGPLGPSWLGPPFGRG